MTADFFAAERYALERLKRDVPVYYCYHDIVHTRDDVLPAAVRIGEVMGVHSADLLLLKTAALFHDLGFTQQATGHEEVSAMIAEQVLGGMGYAASQVAVIQQAIRATALPQSPTSQIAQILCDADLDVLGRNDFLPRNLLLYAELCATGSRISLAQWFSGQYNFLKKHAYHTQAAHSLRHLGKTANMRLLATLRHHTVLSGAGVQ